MRAFLEEIVLEIQKEYESISDLIIVLPSKRAGGFFKHYLRKHLKKITFSPTVVSIEEFIEQLSGLSIVSNDTLLIKSYEAYLNTEEIQNKDDFPTFTSWANALLNDFSEIDRYLIPPSSFFSYLSGIKSLEKWGVTEEETPLIKNYLSFWNNLLPFYENLTYLLSERQEGYQGMVYRKAAEDIEHYVSHKGHKPHYFVGFNALNTSEQHIIQALLETGNAQVRWDTDAYFYEDKSHTASLFLRSYITEWKYYQQHPIPRFPRHYESPKQVKMVAAQNSIEEVKYTGEYLAQLPEEMLDQTAVILADEALLIPLLYSLPKNISKVNVTMGFPLKGTPVASFFSMLLKLHAPSPEVYYHKDIKALLNHPVCRYLIHNPEHIVAAIDQGNISYISIPKIQSLGGDRLHVKTLFDDWSDQSKIAIERCNQLLDTLVSLDDTHAVEKLCFQKLQEIFSNITTLLKTHSYLSEITTLERLFGELLSTMNLDFEGDAYDGLQIMGVLETRVLDFENIIMLSVNEGTLPAGKSTASFITYDLKQQFGLPLYTDKDAVYTYHFYRLLQRATSITLLYNSFTQGLSSGEKSRFLMQMEIEALPDHDFTFEAVTSPISIEKKLPKTVAKNDHILATIGSIAGHYFSPSALTQYIRNPMDFYYQKILSINEKDQVEEIVALNTLGTIVHNTLEVLYTPFEGKLVTIDLLKDAKSKIDASVRLQFKDEFKEGDFQRGKNLIIFEVAKRYVSNIINLDIASLTKGHTLKILQLENMLKTAIEVPGLDFPIYIGGKVDRIDELDGTVRIIDYKTGMVQQRELEILNWGEIIEDYSHSKAFQVLAYALIIQQELGIQKLEAGVISLKNMAGGFLKFAKREKPRGGAKDSLITPEMLQNFKKELEQLILEICDANHPFTDILHQK
ncbi:PD-(D/E)XK nuclease family protein [Aureisphaera galaxeae]|uniref:PD-(D/E)XK nuclease family protein n=1 Tax=Aureisphaera galaxeae TaxID=1538023 RepID=UPI002350C3EC|nr:PD-(D/E)XK nuclease family protein [Aureisphaera galaxeae]MDC8005230.1 PD-(D/E)XK nuclease family protein [Aureisphaera galaxeae]